MGSPALRALARGGVERVLVGTGLAAAARARNAATTLVLAYHNVVPASEPVRGDRSLHLSRRDFARQLELLARTHDVVPLDEALAPPRGSRPRAVVTFDDACRGAVTAGVEELAARGLPATIFVAPGLLGGTFWWDELARPGHGLDARVRRIALEELGGDGARVRAWAAAGGAHAHTVPAHQAGATGAELASAAAHPGITLGAHSWSHPCLPALGAEELGRELRRPLEWLRERFPAAAIPWLAYPYGLASPAVERAAEAAGYRGAFRVEGGAIPRGGDLPRFALPRLNVPAGLSARGFELRASGLVR